MRLTACLPLIICLWPSTASAADLAKIDRSIAKEPTYQTKAPKYCLLVFGPEAKTRSWLVHDGSTLYVDRNGNGDLTEASKKVEAKAGDWTDPKEGVYYFEIGDVQEGSLRHRQLLLSVSKLDNWGASLPDIKTLISQHPEYRGYTLRLDVEMAARRGIGLGGRVVQRAGPIDYSGVLQFGDSPKTAPILHFRGPWQLTLEGKQSLAAGRERDLTLTLGIGPGALVCTGYEKLVPEAVHPQVAIEYPPPKAGASAVHELYELKERC
jgi:hypothetical protein